MAANKQNPNLTQAQYNVLAARVNAATGYSVKNALYEKRKPKETAALIAARKLLKEHEAKCSQVLKDAGDELEKAKNTALDAVLFQTQEKAHAAVKALEAKYV
jgi:hypothetical protein